MMAGMAMGTPMILGMILIISGLVVGTWGLLPDPATRQRMRQADSRNAMPVSALDDLKLSRPQWLLVGALTIGLVVDTMKPATLGFVIPSMAAEYGISLKTAALLPLVAIIGTVVGSLTWGRLADIYGRRATILLSALMYVATSICGFMPAFGWNLVMCFLMGAAAGGMLPTVYSLASESLPSRHRGWILVMMSGVGATLGYLVASGAATLIEPVLGWRALWLLGAPTGLILVALSRFIPESPRFLTLTGRHEEAHAVMVRFGMALRPQLAATVPDITWPRLAGEEFPRRQADGFAILAHPSYVRRSVVIVLYGVGWSIVNWGFITFLPSYLSRAGLGASSSGLLFLAAVISLPMIGVASILYVRYGGKRAMLIYAMAVALVLVVFAITNPATPGNPHELVLLTAILLTGNYGMIAMLSCYAAELYPTALRASGSGLAAAASKIGGVFGPLLLTSAPGIPALALWTLLPLSIAIAVLWRFGPLVTARPLTDAIAVSQTPAQR